MKLHQLFKKLPDADLLRELLDCFNLTGIDDGTTFSKFDLGDTPRKFTLLIPRLSLIYLPCKARVYLHPNKAVVVLRQIVKLFRYRLHSYETTCSNTKLMMYKIVPDNEEVPPMKRRTMRIRKINLKMTFT